MQDWVVEALEKLGEEGIIDDEPGREYRSKIEKKG